MKLEMDEIKQGLD